MYIYRKTDITKEKIVCNIIQCRLYNFILQNMKKKNMIDFHDFP